MESPGQFMHLVNAFRRGLNEVGYVEHRNVGIDYGWAEGRPDRLPGLVAELISRKVSVIAATGGPLTARAAKAASTTIPVVFVVGSDPVREGLVGSLNHPGTNLTGVMLFIEELVAKRLELARELIPQARVIGALSNPSNPTADQQVREAQDAARALGLELHIAKASSEAEFELAFAALIQHRVAALLVEATPFFNSRREQLIALAVSAITQFDGAVCGAFEGQACGTAVPIWPDFPIPVSGRCRDAGKRNWEVGAWAPVSW